MLTTALILATVGQAPLSSIQLNRIKTYDNVKCLAVAAAPSGARVAVSSEDRVVRVMDLAKGTTLFTLTGHPQPAYGLAFNPAGTLLATGDESARIWIWDLKTGKKIREFNRTAAHVRGIQNLSFSADGKQLLSTGKDDVLIAWDVASGKKLRMILGAGVNLYSAKFSPAGGRLYTATLGKGVLWYDLKNGKVISGIDGTDGQGIIDLDVSKDGTRVLAAGRDSNAQWMDTKSGKRIGFLRGHQDWVVRAALSPNARYGATASTDRTVKIWDLKTMTAVKTIEGESSVGATLAFTGDGKFLVTSSDQESLQVWTVAPAQAAAAIATKGKKR